MRIVTLNLNGIRSAAGKGFYEWLAEQDADIVCLQETRCEATHRARSRIRIKVRKNQLD